MLTTVEGVYKDGAIELAEKPDGLTASRVLVTFLSDSSGGSPKAAPRQGQMHFGMFPQLLNWIVEHGRVPAFSVVDVQAALDADARFTIYPLDRAVMDRSQGLTAINEMHDRQIVATALMLADTGERVALLTHDANIIASGLVPIV